MLKKIALMTACLLPASALAGPYFLAGVASGNADMGDIEATYTGAGVNVDDKVARVLIGGGVAVSQHLAFEVLYMTKVENSVKQGTFSDRLDHQGVQLAVIGKAPLAAQFSLLGKLSANLLMSEYEYTDTANPNSYMKSDQSAVYVGVGVGAEFQASDAITLRVQAERLMMSGLTIVGLNGLEEADADVTQVSVAVKFNF